MEFYRKTQRKGVRVVSATSARAFLKTPVLAVLFSLGDAGRCPPCLRVSRLARLSGAALTWLAALELPLLQACYVDSSFCYLSIPVCTTGYEEG